MSELNPFEPPAPGVDPAAPQAPVGVPVDDPLRLALWSNGLLIGTTVLGLVEHAASMLAKGQEGAMLALAGGVSSLSGIVSLAATVVFLSWMYRTVRNARRVDPDRVTLGPGFAVGSFFIPILNFWIPCQALMQTSRVTGRSVGLVLVWWLCSLGIMALALTYVVMILRTTTMVPETGAWDPGEEEAWNTVGPMDHALVALDVLLTFLEVSMVMGLARVQHEWALGPAARE